MALELDTTEILDKFDQLDSKNQVKTFRAALRSAMNILVKEAKVNLKQAVPSSTQVTTKGKFKGLKLSNGIQTKVWKDNKTAKVNILKDGRLKWIEKGTEPRETKMGKRKVHSTGSIQPTNFFTKARTSTENQVFEKLDEIIMSQIKKTWDKNNKESQ